ncbi:MAG: DnaA regulatory inactivator Hda [Rudaea sp.]|uniref:DnaA regulatory inactivator Hda n=1 Tax=Rudaea sp. TaxID=2136325 RepID=UPI0039E3260C
MKPDQLPLAMRWPAQQRLETFLAGDNGTALDLVRRAATDAEAPWAFLAGAPASGKTHLLIAACAAASAVGRRAQYLSLRHAAAAPDAIRALGGSDLLALDDLDAIAGDRGAEHALFDLYNRCKVEKCTLIFAASRAPAQIGIGLPDLLSRLSACAQAPLRPLTDEGRREVLRQRAAARGIELDDAALAWLFARSERDLASLAALLDRLDRESLAAKRRVTVPFLRKLLAS